MDALARRGTRGSPTACAISHFETNDIDMANTLVARTALALASCALATFTQGAHAQSSVTLFGTVDAGLVYSTNQQTTQADGQVGS